MKKQIAIYKSTDGDQITISKVGTSIVVEIDAKVPGKKKRGQVEEETEEEFVQVTKVKRLTKEDRIAKIKVFVDQKKTRTEIKDIMYTEGIYQHSPNPASAFAGDWNSINNN